MAKPVLFMKQESKPRLHGEDIFSQPWVVRYARHVSSHTAPQMLWTPKELLSNEEFAKVKHVQDWNWETGSSPGSLINHDSGLQQKY